MTKKEMDLLEKVYEAERGGGLHKSNSKAAKNLEKEGFIAMSHRMIRVGIFGHIDVTGHKLTKVGRMSYCASDRCKEEPTLGEKS